VEASRLPHFADNGLTDGGEHYALADRGDSWSSNLLETELTPGTQG
jgi:hypothetical protein